MPKDSRDKSSQKTLIKATGLGNFGECANMAVVDVKDGKIVRFRPFPYDWKYKPEEFEPWEIKARGQVFKAPLKSILSPFTLGYKKRIYVPCTAHIFIGTFLMICNQVRFCGQIIESNGEDY